MTLEIELNETLVTAGDDNPIPVEGQGDLIDVTLTLDTSAYSDGDVLADTQVVANALRKNDGTGVLQSLVVIDEDDQGIGFDLLFFQSEVSLGVENAAPSITDANVRSYLGKVRIDAADYNDWGGARTATKLAVGMFLKSASGTRNIYVAAVVRNGAPTYTANGLKIRLGILWN